MVKTRDWEVAEAKERDPIGSRGGGGAERGPTAGRQPGRGLPLDEAAEGQKGFQQPEAGCIGRLRGSASSITRHKGAGREMKQESRSSVGGRHDTSPAAVSRVLRLSQLWWSQDWTPRRPDNFHAAVHGAGTVADNCVEEGSWFAPRRRLRRQSFERQTCSSLESGSALKGSWRSQS
jgi:hypothetical protein